MTSYLHWTISLNSEHTKLKHTYSGQHIGVLNIFTCNQLISEVNIEGTRTDEMNQILSLETGCIVLVSGNSVQRT